MKLLVTVALILATADALLPSGSRNRKLHTGTTPPPDKMDKGKTSGGTMPEHKMPAMPEHKTPAMPEKGNEEPTMSPTYTPTATPTVGPTIMPTVEPTAMPTMAPSMAASSPLTFPCGCEHVRWSYKHSEYKAGKKNATLGVTLQFPFYDMDSGDEVGMYLTTSTNVGANGSDCTFQSIYNLDLKDSYYTNQIMVQGTCLGKTNAITGGTNEYGCASGYEFVVQTPESEPGRLDLILCSKGCGDSSGECASASGNGMMGKGKGGNSMPEYGHNNMLAGGKGGDSMPESMDSMSMSMSMPSKSIKGKRRRGRRN